MLLSLAYLKAAPKSFWKEKLLSLHTKIIKLVYGRPVYSVFKFFGWKGKKKMSIGQNHGDGCSRKDTFKGSPLLIISKGALLLREMHIEYFNRLLGAACTCKLVIICFWPFSDIYLLFNCFSFFHLWKVCWMHLTHKNIKFNVQTDVNIIYIEIDSTLTQPWWLGVERSLHKRRDSASVGANPV